MTKKSLIHWFGIMGIISLVSYTAAVCLAPLAYPNYDWLKQAVSDLSAIDSPALLLWNQLNSLYVPFGMASIMLVIVYIQNKLNKTIRLGIYIFAAMVLISGVGYAIFPLTTGGYAGTTLDIMHVYVITPLVVLTSMSSLVLIMIGGFKKRAYVSLSILASIALGAMLIGAIGLGAFPNLFGFFERFNVFAAVGFNAVLGIYLLTGFSDYKNVSSNHK